MGSRLRVPGAGVPVLQSRKPLFLLSWLGTASAIPSWPCGMQRMQSSSAPPVALPISDPLAAKGRAWSGCLVLAYLLSISPLC